MKNATKHADELKSLFKKLLKEGKPEPKQAEEPLEALVRGAMGYDVSDNRADDAMKAIKKEFVDLNELRVATELEVQDILGSRYPAIEDRVSIIAKGLNHIFEKEHTLSLDRLKTIPKKEARQFLRDMPEMNAYVEAYVLMYGFDGAAFPLDQTTLDYLKLQGIVEEDMNSIDEAQRFVENYVKSEDLHDFFRVIRRAVIKKK